MAMLPDSRDLTPYCRGCLCNTALDEPFLKVRQDDGDHVDRRRCASFRYRMARRLVHGCLKRTPTRTTSAQGGLAQRNPPFVRAKEAGYAGACHRAALCADPLGYNPPFGLSKLQSTRLGAAVSQGSTLPTP
jgi:hypothetical protein